MTKLSLDELIELATKINDGDDEETHEYYCSLIEKVTARIADALANTPPPFLPSDREAFYSKQRHKILHAIFNLGRVIEQQMTQEDPKAFRDFVDGLDLNGLT